MMTNFNIICSGIKKNVDKSCQQTKTATTDFFRENYSPLGENKVSHCHYYCSTATTLKTASRT